MRNVYSSLWCIHTRLYFATHLQSDHQNTMHVCLPRGMGLPKTTGYLGWEECINSPWKLWPPLSWRRKTAMTLKLIIPSLDIENFEMKWRLFLVIFLQQKERKPGKTAPSFDEDINYKTFTQLFSVSCCSSATQHDWHFKIYAAQYFFF